MWDPNETLAAWARDDDVVSWRSLDTLRGVELDLSGADDPFHDSASDASDREELVEMIDRRMGPLSAPGNLTLTAGQRAGEKPHRSPVQQATRLEFESDSCSSTSTSASGLLRGQVLNDINGGTTQMRRQVNEVALRELPSTSEMVSIREPLPVATRPLSPAVDREWMKLEAPETLRHGIDRVDGGSAPQLTFRMHEPAFEALQRSHAQHTEPRRVSMTLGDLFARKKAAADTILLPPPPPVSLLPVPGLDNPPRVVDSSVQLHDVKLLERRCDDLVEKERNLQTVLVKQLHQIETMTDQLRQQDTKLQNQQLELSGLKEQVGRLERQNATLQSTVRDKEQAQDQQTQLLVQKTNELSALETKVRSLQIANESFQEQARKASDDKDKVHKDYLQVVYDLGKLQKQMNAAAKETVNVAEKDLLLREIDQLRHEKDQLTTKLKESETRKASLLQNNAAVEAQKMRELQGRVRELEEDLHRARNTRSTPPQNQPSYAPASFVPPTGSISQPTHRQSLPSFAGVDGSASTLSQHEYLRASINTATPPMASWGAQDLSGMPSLLGGVTAGSSGARPMTLKDMVGDRRPPPTTASSTTSLASMGFSSADRRSSGVPSGTFNAEQFKADALARRGTSISDMLRQQAMPLEPPEYSFSAPPNPAVSAPFATEKQTLLHDSLQKRDLEQRLLKLHVEKEQMEAKLCKVEQTGLKTMNGRNEKTWLESRLRELTLDIARLKLSLR